MSDNSKCNSAINAVATTKINHAQLGDFPLSTLKKLHRGGIRPGEAIRTITQARKMLDKVPYS